MNRRKFFSTMIGGVAATAAVRTWPFRVFSFPSEPILLSKIDIGEMYIRPAIENIAKEIDERTLMAQYRAGVLGRGFGFEWFMHPAEVYNRMAEQEIEVIRSMPPQSFVSFEM